jgi:hypothetical protein
MKRLWIILLAAAMALSLLLVAAAAATSLEDFCIDNPDHGRCPTTTTTVPTTTTKEPPGFANCSFNDAGVLESWHGHEGEERTCVWNVDEPSDTFQFQIKSPDESVTKVKLPHLIVNADIVFPTPKCFEAWQRSPQNLPFPSDDLWTFSPAANDCGDGPYLLTISIQGLKSELENVDLVMTQTP